MKIIITKLTSQDLISKAMSYTSDSEVKLSDRVVNQMYDSQHSPIRTQIYMVEMLDIPTFVSVHFVRHSIGITHYVKSNRFDRSNVNEVADRNTLVNHMMLLNAESLINIARKRLCFKASDETREVMEAIVLELNKQNDILANYLMPECWYRGGECHEQKGCGIYNGYKNTSTYVYRLMNITGGLK
jgi:hypothetical protein